MIFALGEDVERQEEERDTILTLLDSSDPERAFEGRHRAVRQFSIPIDGQRFDIALPCIVFDKEGKVKLPGWDATEYLHLGVTEGNVEEGQRILLNFRTSTVHLGTPTPEVDLLTIVSQTGRSREVGINTQQVSE